VVGVDWRGVGVGLVEGARLGCGVGSRRGRLVRSPNRHWKRKSAGKSSCPGEHTPIRSCISLCWLHSLGFGGFRGWIGDAGVIGVVFHRGHRPAEPRVEGKAEPARSRAAFLFVLQECWTALDKSRRSPAPEAQQRNAQADKEISWWPPVHRVQVPGRAAQSSQAIGLVCLGSLVPRFTRRSLRPRAEGAAAEEAEGRRGTTRTAVVCCLALARTRSACPASRTFA